MNEVSRKFLNILSAFLLIFLFGWVTPGLAASPTITTSGDATYASPATVTLKGTVYDAEGGDFDYLWQEVVSGGTELYCSGTVTLSANQTLNIPDCIFDGLAMGEHSFILSVTDKTESVTMASLPVVITISDETAPTLAPVVNPSILWPPNNKLVPVVVTPNAADNSGAAPVVKATVTSSEAVKIVGRSKKATTVWQTPVYNADGTITFQLPAQRLGKAKGRIYTITLTATDASGNASTADVTVLVPHDRGKKTK